jgi:hypothetical protein
VPEPFNFTRDVLESHAVDRQRVALRFVDDQGVIDRRTFDDVATAAGQWAAFLRARGLVPGDRVLVLLGPSAVWPAVLLGVLKAGGVAVPCPQTISRDELELRLGDSGARLLVIDRERAAPLSALDGVAEVIVCEEVAPEVRGLMAVQPTHDTMQADPAFILSPAGGQEAQVSHLFTRGALQQAERGLDVRPDDLVWCTAETGSASSVWDGLLVPWAAGAAIVIHGARFDPQQRLDLIHRLGVTVLRQAPDEYRQMVERTLENGGLGRLRRAVAVGGALDPGVAEAFRTMCGVTVSEEKQDKAFERSGSFEPPTVAATRLVDTPDARVSDETIHDQAATAEAQRVEDERLNAERQAADQRRAEEARRAAEGQARDDDRRKDEEKEAAKEARLAERRAEEERRAAAAQAEIDARERKRQEAEARRAAEAQAKDDERRRKDEDEEATKEARLAERRAEEEHKAAAAQAEIDARERKRQEEAAAAAAQRTAAEARRVAEAKAKDDERRRKEEEKEAAKEARLAERRAEEERKAAAAQAEVDARERKRRDEAVAAEAKRAAAEAQRAAAAKAKDDERRRKEEEKEAAAQAKRNEAERRTAERQAEANRRAAAEAEKRRLAERARAEAQRPPREEIAEPVAATATNGSDAPEPDDGPNEMLMERLRAYTHHGSDAADDPPPQ